MPPLLTSLRMPLQERPAQAADEPAARRERQAVGDDGVENRDQRGDGEARHDGVADVLLADHAAVEEAEARDRHHQDERDRGQHPRRVAARGRAVRHDGGNGGNGGVFVGGVDRGDRGGASRRRRRGGLGRGGGGGRRGGAAAGAAAARRGRSGGRGRRGRRRLRDTSSPARRSRSARLSPALARGR